MAEHLIVRSNIKKITGEFNVAGDFEDSLNNKIEAMIKEAVESQELPGMLDYKNNPNILNLPDGILTKKINWCLRSKEP